MPTIIDEVSVEQVDSPSAPSTPATQSRPKPDMTRIMAELRRDEARLVRLAAD